MNTYEEISPSGKGIHHLFTVNVDRIPYSLNSKSKKKLSSAYYSKNPHNINAKIKINKNANIKLNRIVK